MHTCRQKVRRLETAGRRTFHRGRRRARGGECVNSGEGPFARLIKGLDAERVRGRLIKPLDFVCVAWSFIQGYKSATKNKRLERQNWQGCKKEMSTVIHPSGNIQ